MFPTKSSALAGAGANARLAGNVVVFRESVPVPFALFASRSTRISGLICLYDMGDEVVDSKKTADTRRVSGPSFVTVKNASCI